ncbi:hypothetical protein COCNU_06G017020 [Cocos nucifera]|uniref:[RNA-polymerase]-subunit kinase n=1 Tax=Cocos nucifera TaxID=13894 RepID=A0A8K0N3C8_COCNU|nr:hypothetical protein COCNU_06G017020 [Cocos nucifera]
MGCVASKNVALVTPVIDSAGLSGNLEAASSSLFNRPKLGSHDFGDRSESGESGKISSASNSTSFRLGNLHRYIEGEQVAAGWPAWLTAVAGEAIQGWVPLKAESFEKMGKIGQGTYSSVFKARELDTGKTVALKKVQFDVYEPESVRFMAREIQILRRLNHPNVVKLEGLITSRLSSSIYLVFDYMEHDLAGLLSSPDIKFSEPQIKCYMQQLLSGLEHCHSHGIMHRDIKCANLLINNEGILKIADFGLANFFSAGQKQPLTSRVVTLWYRPPELLLGSTDYEASVDLWSVGCVFAEVFLGKPIFQGRTEDSWKTTGGSGSGAKRDPRENGDTRPLIDLQSIPEISPPDKGHYVKQTCQKDILPSGLLQVSASGGFAWAKKPKENCSYIKSHSRSSTRSHTSHALDHLNISHAKNPSNLKGQADRYAGHASHSKSNSCKPYEIAKNEMLIQLSEPEISERYKMANHVIMNQWSDPRKLDLLDSFDSYHSRDLSDALYKRETKSTKCSISVLDYQDRGQRVKLSGPLLSPPYKIDELLEKHGRHIR